MGATAWSDEELRDLLSRAEEVLGGLGADPLRQKYRARRERAIAFLGLDPAEAAQQGLALDVEAATRAIEQMKQGRAPTPDEVAALELCIRFMRPAWLLVAGKLKIDGPMCPPADRERLEAAARAVVAITLNVPGDEDDVIGTGFLIAPDLVITNMHVRDAVLVRFSMAVERRSGFGGDMALARFGLEEGSAGRWSVPIAAEAARHPQEDIAVLRLAKSDRMSGWPIARLAPVDVAIGMGRPVAVIGHPVRDQRNPLFQAAVFGTGGEPGVTRVAPGRVVGADGLRFFHDCSTLGGNSGSPVIDPHTGEVLGVHNSGEFAVKNGAISVTALWTQPSIRNLLTSGGAV